MQTISLRQSKKVEKAEKFAEKIRNRREICWL